MGIEECKSVIKYSQLVEEHFETLTFILNETFIRESQIHKATYESVFASFVADCRHHSQRKRPLLLQKDLATLGHYGHRGSKDSVPGPRSNANTVAFFWAACLVARGPVHARLDPDCPKKSDA